MGYRDLEHRRHARWTTERMRRRRSSMLAILAAYTILAVGALIFWLALIEERPVAPGGDTLTLSFGFGRDPITREYTTEIESPATGDSAETIGVRLRSDLRNEAGTSEFPSNQVAIGVTRLADDRIYLSFTANPWSPESVPAGVYDGEVEIDNGGATTRVPVQMYLGGRDNQWAVMAFLLLLAGATLGLVVKWITESLTPRAGLMRRFANLRRAIGYGEDGTNLPVAVRMDVDDLADRIDIQDFARAEELFKKFEENRLKLADISSRFDVLYDQLAEQSRVLEAAQVSGEDDLLLNGMLDAQYRSLLELQGMPWPDQEPEIIDKSIESRIQFGIAASAVLTYLERKPDARLREVLSCFQEGDFHMAVLEYRQYQESPRESSSTEADAVMTSAASSLKPSPSADTTERSEPWSTQPLSWLFRNARPIAALASVIVVSLVGLKTEYLENQSFNGSLGAWLTLGLWALVIELSGLSVLDVVGRLGGNAVGSAGNKT